MTRRSAQPALVGREAELAAVAAGLAAATDGRPRIMAIVGEAGIGKTRLAAEAVADARRNGHAVGVGHCLHVIEGASPYGALREAIGAMVGRRAASRLFGQRSLSEHHPGERTLLFREVADTLRAVDGSPALVVIEDIQWADKSTRDMLLSLAEAKDLPVVLLLTARREDAAPPSPLASFLLDLEQRAQTESVSIGPLSADEVAMQARNLLGRPPDAGIIESIQRRAMGNPLYVEELVTAAAAGLQMELPPTIADAILVRVAELPDHAQHILRLCAVGGPRVSHALLRAVAGLDDTELESGLRTAIRRQLLSGERDRGEDAYIFRHALVHEAMYEDLLPPERTRLHTAFARVLEGDPALVREPVLAAAERARHLEGAHQLERAREAWVEAARAALDAVAYPEADDLFTRALSLPTQPSVPDAGEARLWHEAATAARLAADTPRATDYARQALSVTPVDNVEERTRLYVQLSTYLWDGGRSREALQASEEAARLARSLPDSEAKVEGLTSLASVQLVLGFHEQCRRVAQEAYAVAVAAGSSRLEARVLEQLGPAKVCLGLAAEGVADMRRAVELLSGSRAHEVLNFAVQHYLTCLYLAYGPAVALSSVEELIAHAEARGSIIVQAELTSEFARLLLDLGRYRESRERLELYVPERAPRSFDAASAADWAMLEAALGHFDLAHAALAKARELTADTDEIHVVMPAMRAEAYVAMMEGVPEKAVEVAERGMRAGLPGARDLEFGWPLFVLGLCSAADIAQQARARRSSTSASIVASAEVAAARFADRLLAEVFTESPNPQHALWRSLAHAELARTRGGDEPALWTEAAAHALAGQLVPYRAYALMRQAVALARDPLHRVEATALMRDAHHLAIDMDAVAQRRKIERLARQARLPLQVEETGRRRVPEGPYPDGLSEREREVLALMVAGNSNRQIAQSLFITEKTAGAHVSSILAKLGVASRGEAAALAIRHGMVEL